MPVISLITLNRITLEMAEESIRDYCTQNGPWLMQFDSFFRNIRLNATPDERMIKLLSIVRYNRWNMNRQGQCEKILRKIRSGEIKRDILKSFWNLIDELPNINLRDLPGIENVILNQFSYSFKKIRRTLSSWHQSAGSICFLTKVILMFNWGQTPAFDTRIRQILGVNNNISEENLVEALVEIGKWVRHFETQNNINLDEFATGLMLQTSGRELQPLPLGRSFDMMLFSLPV
jgi:hypothetical protein